MPQLLTVLALSCPNLRRLSIKLPTEYPACYKEYDHEGYIDDGGDWDTWAGCLPLLQQLDVLVLDGMHFRPWTIDEYHGHDDQNHDHLLRNLINGGSNYAVEDFFDGLNLKVSLLCSFISYSISFRPIQICK